MDHDAQPTSTNEPQGSIKRSSQISSATVSASGEVYIRVLAAATGVCYRIGFPLNELRVANLRRNLAAAVPPSDQIFLLGPPYKVPKDSTLRSAETLRSLRLGDAEDESSVGCALTTTERTGARRLFLFSKESLSESPREPVRTVLEPQTVHLPSNPDPSPVVFPSPPSPLHQALEVYERRFMLHLCRGKALADGADLRVSASQKCVAEQSVMARALRAAVSNLSDHRSNAARTRSEFMAEFQEVTGKHAGLIGNFDGILKELEEEVLHPSLVTMAKNSGRMMETLLDTVPVEREKAWVVQCKTAHDRLMTLFAEVDAAFNNLQASGEATSTAESDRDAERKVMELSQRVEDQAMTIRKKQQGRLEKLMDDHGSVVSVVTSAISGGESSSAQASFTILEEMSKSSEQILPEMIADDNILLSIMNQVSEAKHGAMTRMNSRLRQVSVTQSNIQKVLSSVAVLREALHQQCENMIHLEHVAELKSAYREFLCEIRRRRMYGSAVTCSSAQIQSRLSAMRMDEVKQRERFLRGPGKHLMPPFYEIFAPTLATPPPTVGSIVPPVVEMDSLPNIPMEEGELPSSETTMGSDSLDAPPQQSIPAATDNVSKELAQPDQPSLIVSADDTTTSNEPMEVSGDDKLSIEAERKTLAYENVILRQALERLGGKPPKSYIQEVKNLVPSEPPSSSSKPHEITILQSRIRQLDEQIAAYKSDTRNLKAKVKKLKQTDKIAHSSFEVGDVGLFMPTGRSTVGNQNQRTYLAFHSNCPHRYLSTESIEGTPDYVLGRIVYQEERIAGASIGSDTNPFRLNPGTKFWVLTVEVIKVP